MKIALFGYGAMGKEIEQIALKRGHQIALIIDIDNREQMTQEKLQGIDVAIEFTEPGAARANFSLCFDAGLPIVTGTTGWNEQLNEVEQECKDKDASFFYASNFSLGVNLFFELNRRLAGMMDKFDIYDVEMEEVHHTRKKDAPSGTAITLAEDLIEGLARKKSWKKEKAEKNEEIAIKSLREGDVPGIHQVHYESDMDEITIRHSLKNRKGLALGSVLAAEFLNGKKGIYTMKDLMQF